MLVCRDNIIPLLENALAGNEEAFTMLVQIYECEVHRYLASLLGDYDEAYDFAQQVFFKAWLNLATLKDLSSFKPWLYMIARNLIRDYWRSKKAHYQSWEYVEMNNPFENVPGPEESVIRAELIKLALAELAPKLRDCLLLKVISGCLRHEIAQIVGISETSVGTYVSSARRQFYKAYQRLANEQETKAVKVSRDDYVEKKEVLLLTV